LQLAAVEGDLKRGCFMAGQISGMVKKEQTAKEIIDELVVEFVEAIKSKARYGEN
jgi:enoyl-[acyl-carrier protein] reductase II